MQSIVTYEQLRMDIASKSYLFPHFKECLPSALDINKAQTNLFSVKTFFYPNQIAVLLEKSITQIVWVFNYSKESSVWK